MSRSNNTEIVNPAKRFYQWSGEEGGFNYYDKEKKVKVQCNLPFKFVVLDTLATIKGWSDAYQSGYWANEVRDLRKEPFIIHTAKGIYEEGLYADVHPKCPGAKYVQSVYAMMKEGDDGIIVNFQIMGAALGAWIEFRKKNKIYDGGIQIKTMLDGKKGKTEYKIPVFEKMEITPETDSRAKELDEELQQYLKGYFERNAIPKEELEPTVQKIDIAQEKKDWMTKGTLHGKGVEHLRNDSSTPGFTDIADEVLKPHEDLDVSQEMNDLPF